MPRRAVTPVDSIWLTMDRPTNPMVIESVMMLDGQVDWDRFLDVVSRRVLDQYPVFSQRLVPSRFPLVAQHWEDDPDFHLSRHIHHAVLDPPGDDYALQEYLTSGISRQLPRDRPLWEMHLIDGFGAGSAVYSRFHHALADGVALTRVLLSLTDDAPDSGGPNGVPGVGPDGRSEHDGSHGLVDQALRLAEGTGTALLDLPHVLSPAFAGHAFKLARQTGDVAAKLLFTRYPESPIAGIPRVGKRAVWAPPIPLIDVVTMAHRTGATVNDVLVAALAGALTSYVETHGGGRVDIPAMVPVDVRPPDEPLPPELGNRFALVLLILPTGLGTSFERLAETKRRMDAIKHSPEAVLTFGIMRVIGAAGPDVGRPLVDFFANKASGVITNVRGPAQPRYIVGTRVTRLLGWVPESGNQSLGTCIFTYDGNVHVGFKVDAERVPDPESLVDLFVAELDALEQLGAQKTRRSRKAPASRNGSGSAKATEPHMAAEPQKVARSGKSGRRSRPSRTATAAALTTPAGPA